MKLTYIKALQWSRYERDSVSNHQCLDCLFSRLFRRRSKKSKVSGTGLCEGNPPMTGGSSHKEPETRKKFPSDDDILALSNR